MLTFFIGVPLLLLLTLFFALLFHNPRCIHLFIRAWIRHERDHKAAIALREMKYTDLRRSR